MHADSGQASERWALSFSLPSLPVFGGRLLIPSFLPSPSMPMHDKTIVVTRCGRICLGKKKINFSQVFAGQAVGIKEVHEDIWLVSFMDYDLGYFDLETRVLEPLENPFGPKVLPMS
jgi:putative transposase